MGEKDVYYHDNLLPDQRFHCRHTHLEFHSGKAGQRKNAALSHRFNSTGFENFSFSISLSKKKNLTANPPQRINLL
jgi:hypothetical protein